METDKSAPPGGTNICSDEPLQLIEFIRNDGEGNTTTIKLREDTFKVVSEKAGSRPLSTICICGPSRQGKSFILGYMIRCLEALENDKLGWMDWSNKSKPLEGFKFQNGTTPLTQGIWVWSRPFIVKNDEGKEVAVLLIDTQGTCNEFITQKDTSAIVGLSLLISSVVIFNCFNNLQEDVLTVMNTYTHYGQLALNETNDTPFQKLIFLIRDWNNPDDYPYGGKGGKIFLEEKLRVKDDQPPEAKEVRNTIRKCFKELDCFLMPYIGDKSLSKNFTGSIAELNINFAKHMEEFISNLINSNSLVIKEICGGSVTASKLKSYLENYLEIFNSKAIDEMIPPQIDMETIDAINKKIESALVTHINKNMTRRSEAEKKYAESMKELTAKFEEEVQQSLADNKFAELNDLRRLQEQITACMVESWKKPTEKNFHKSCQTKPENKLQNLSSETQKENKIQLEQCRLKAEIGIENLCREFEDFLDEAMKDIEDTEKFEQIYKPLRAKILRDFAENNPFPAEHSLYDEFNKKLETQLDIIIEKNEQEVIEFQQVVQEAYIHAVQSGIRHYVTEMKEILSTSDFMSEKDLQVEHDRLREESLQEFENYEKLGIPDNALNYKLQVQVDIGGEFQNFQDENKMKRELAKGKAQHCVTDCKARYDEVMKTKMDRVRTEEQLGDFHRMALREAKQMLHEKCPAKEDAEFVLYYEGKLEVEILDLYEEQKDLFETRRNAFKVILDCRKYYHDEMQKHCKNTPFIRPKELEAHHKQSVAVVLEKCEKQVDLSAVQNLDLEDEMKALFEKYQIKNDMKLNYARGLAPAIGIDLGTTYCCVAVYINGEVIIIPNQKQGNAETTASYVAYNPDGSKTFGDDAKQNAFRNPENTIYDAKRILGRKFNDPELQRDMKFWPFEVREEDGIPKINVNGKLLFPEQVSAVLLEEFRVMAEKHLQLDPGTIKKAVITVPAYFNDRQRQATMDAGKLAGLEVAIINEPIAAAIAYSLERLDNAARKVLIFCLEKRTFDVAVLDVISKYIQTLSVNGDTHLGGVDFDQKMMEYCAQVFKDDTGNDLMKGKDSSNKNERYEAQRRLKRLQNECENAKKIMSSAESTTISLDVIYNGIDLNLNLERKSFDKLNETYFRKIIDIMEEALEGAGLRKEDIEDIVLVGGSTGIPKVQEMLSNYFGGRALNYSIHPDQVVAYGAAVKAAMMNGKQARGSIDFDRIEVALSSSVGLEEEHNGNRASPMALGIDYSNFLVDLQEEQHLQQKRAQQEKMRIALNKVIQKAKADYNKKVENLLKPNPEENDLRTLNSLHRDIKSEILKLLELEIRNKVKEDEPTEMHLKGLETYIDDYWITMIGIYKRKREKQREMAEKERQEDKWRETATTQDKVWRSGENSSNHNASFGSSAYESTKNSRLLPKEEQLKQLKEESIMEECYNAAIDAVPHMLPSSTAFFVQNHLNLSTVNQMEIIYTHVINGTTERHKSAVAPNLWNKFVRRVDDHCKTDCMKQIKSISEPLLNIHRAIKRQFDFNGYFVNEQRLEQMAVDEFQKATVATYDDFSLEMITLGFKKLVEIYKQHNQLIAQIEKDNHDLAMTEVKNIYNEQMKRYLVDAPYSPQSLQNLHSKLMEKLVDAFKNACHLAKNVDEITNQEVEIFRRELDSAFKSCKNTNETKLEKLRIATNKVIQKAKADYNEKVDNLLKRNPEEDDMRTLNSLHRGVKSEALKLLEMEIRKKVRDDEPTENHLKVFETYIDDYWITVIEMYKRKRVRQRETEDKERKERRWKEMQMVAEKEAAVAARRSQAKSSDPNTSFGSSSSNQTLNSKTVPGPTNAAKYESPLPPLVFHLSPSQVKMAMKINGENKLLVNEFNETKTPACVAVTTENKLVYGPEALGLAERHRFTDTSCLWTVAEFYNLGDFSWKGTLIIDKKAHDITPEFMLGYLLRKLKNTVEGQYNGHCSTALIAIPFWLSSPQRILLKDAANIAGFKKSYLINEATAATYSLIKSDLRSSSSAEILVISENLDRVNAFVYSYFGSQRKLQMITHASNYVKEDIQNTTGIIKSNVKLERNGFDYIVSRMVDVGVSKKDEDKDKEKNNLMIRELCKTAIDRANLILKKDVRPNEYFIICEDWNKWGATLESAAKDFGRKAGDIREVDAVLLGCLSLTGNPKDIQVLVRDVLAHDVLRFSSISRGTRVGFFRNDMLPQKCKKDTTSLPDGWSEALFYQEFMGRQHAIGRLGVEGVYQGQQLRPILQITDEAIVTLENVLISSKNADYASEVAQEQRKWITPNISKDQVDYFTTLLDSVITPPPSKVDPELLQAKEDLRLKCREMTEKIANDQSQLVKDVVLKQISEATEFAEHPNSSFDVVRKQMESMQHLCEKYDK